MTSGNKTPVSDQGTGGHSVFAYQLIKELKENEKPFLSTQEIYTSIAHVIANNSEQTPLCRPIRHTGDQGGEFVFVASIKKEPPPTIPKAKQSTLNGEMLFWQSIQDTEDPALFEAYLKEISKRAFLPIAKKKIEALKQKTVVASIPPETSESKLFVRVEPKGSRVRILNIRPKFQQGMVLESGRYHVEVSKRGYQTKKMWIDLGSGEDKELEVKLEQMQASVQPKGINTRPSSSSSNTVKRDGQYVAYANGIVKDTKSGLEWKVGPDKDTDWKEAKSWVENLSLGGGGWRMPTVPELMGLYNKGSGSRNMTPLLKTGGWAVWASGKTDSSSTARIFTFTSKSKYYWFKRDDPRIKRAFAVRSINKPNPSASNSFSNIIARDGVYVAYANGIVEDSGAGLEWKVGPDRNTTWSEARSWVQGLKLDGGEWRMPTLDELATLYSKGAGLFNMTPLLDTTGWWVWSGKTKGASDAWGFLFDHGKSYSNHRNDNNSARAFAVRSHKHSGRQNLKVTTKTEKAEKGKQEERGITEAQKKSYKKKIRLLADETYRIAKDQWKKDDKDFELSDIGEAYAFLGMEKEAMQIAKNDIKKRRYKFYIFTELLKSQARMGQYEEALKQIDKAPDVIKKLRSYCRIAEIVYKNGASKEATQIMEKAKAVQKKLDKTL
jgi:hypothetical protein